MRHFCALLLIIFLLSGCRDKVICPAFQSTYILDDSVRDTYYSYLWKIDKEERLKYLADRRTPSGDTTIVTASLGNGTDYFAYVEEFIVPPNEVKKSKYGIAKYEPYWLKNHRLKSAPMENVLSPPAEEEIDIEEGEFVASDFIDTINVAGDTTSVGLMVGGEEVTDPADTFKLPTIAKVKPQKPVYQTNYLYRYDPADEMLNVEQEYYNKHFGKQLYKKVEMRPDAASRDKRTFWEKIKDFFSFGKRKKQKDEIKNLTEEAEEVAEETSDPAEEASPDDQILSEDDPADPAEPAETAPDDDGFSDESDPNGAED